MTEADLRPAGTIYLRFRSAENPTGSVVGTLERGDGESLRLAILPAATKVWAYPTFGTVKECPLVKVANGEPVKEPPTAWGKEVGGLQAGLGLLDGKKKIFSHGETITLVVRVRNVGEEAVKLQYTNTFPLEKPPVVTDGTGKLIPIMAAASFTSRSVKTADLAPGKEIEVYEWNLDLRPSQESGANKHSTLYAAGKLKLQFSTLAEADTDQALSKLATGKLELEVKADLPQPEVNKPPHVVEKLDMKGRMESGLPWKLDREPTEETIRVATKTFVSKMHSYPDYRFRDFFDPRYLKKHGLADKEIAFEVVGGYRGLHNYIVADDNRSILCTLLRTVDGQEVRELFLLRWVYYEGCLYISPEKAPDPKTGIFTPWILRTKP